MEITEKERKWFWKFSLDPNNKIQYKTKKKDFKQQQQQKKKKKKKKKKKNLFLKYLFMIQNSVILPYWCLYNNKNAHKMTCNLHQMHSIHKVQNCGLNGPRFFSLGFFV